MGFVCRALQGETAIPDRLTRRCPRQMHQLKLCPHSAAFELSNLTPSPPNSPENHETSDELSPRCPKIIRRGELANL